MLRLILAALIIASPALAQNQPGKTKEPIRISKPPAPPKSGQPNARPGDPAKAAKTPTLETVTLTLGAVEMSDELFRLEGTGLTMNLPLGSLAQIATAGTSASAKITPKAPQDGSAAAWLIEVRSVRIRDNRPTAESVARTAMEQLQKAVGVIDRSQTDKEGNVIEKLVQTRATIVEPIKAVVVRAEQAEFERPAARFYIKIPREAKEAGVIRGYTVFQTAPGEFVTFDLHTTETNFAHARPVYEATLATARFTDAAAVAMKRGAAIEAGVNFFARLANPEYDAAIATLNDQWYRLSKPAPGGDDKDAEEVAYRRIRAKRGLRGEINTNAHPDKLTASDREPGLIVRFDARYLQDGQVVDVVGVYWMSSDAKSEAWTLTQAIRDPKKKSPGVVTETGARDADQMHVVTSGSGRDNQRVKPEVPKMGYITQVQSFLLPTLLAQSKTAGEYAFYVYQPQNERLPITTRRDTLAAATDGSGNWVLTTQQIEDRPAQVSTFNEKGELTRTVFAAQQTVWTPTTLGALADTWRAKGLPMD